MVKPRIPPAESFGNTKAIQEKNENRLDDLERTDGSQYARAIEKIKSIISGLAALVENLDEQVADYVADYIALYSYTRAQIEGLGWLSILPPGKGGTGTSNAYNNTFTSGAWRATWTLTDGTLGYAPSLRALKQDIRDAAIDVSVWLSLPVQTFRYRSDVEENGDDAGERIGFIAEDLEEAGLEPWLYRSPEGDLQGVAYELLPLAHHEMIRAQKARIDDLERRLATLEGKE